MATKSAAFIRYSSPERYSMIASRTRCTVSGGRSIKFRRPVVPGDTLIIEAELTKMRGNIGQALGRCLVNGQVVSEAELKFGLQDI